MYITCVKMRKVTSEIELNNELIVSPDDERENKRPKNTHSAVAVSRNITSCKLLAQAPRYIHQSIRILNANRLVYISWISFG